MTRNGCNRGKLNLFRINQDGMLMSRITTHTDEAPGSSERGAPWCGTPVLGRALSETLEALGAFDYGSLDHLEHWGHSYDGPNRCTLSQVCTHPDYDLRCC